MTPAARMALVCDADWRAAHPLLTLLDEHFTVDELRQIMNGEDE